MDHEVRLVQALARHAGGPVHLVGHSFGGTVAMAAALSGTVDVASISLFEGNPITIVRERGPEAVYLDTLRMGRELEARVAAGEADAPGHIIDFWGGAGVYAAMPEAVKAYCRETVRTNVLDWRTVFDWSAAVADYARLHIPVLLVRGERANAAMIHITDALQGCLPQVRSAVVEDAGHFLITSHAPQCAALLSSFLSEVARPPPRKSGTPPPS